jgi:hypothetical protein
MSEAPELAREAGSYTTTTTGLMSGRGTRSTSHRGRAIERVLAEVRTASKVVAR